MIGSAALLSGHALVWFVPGLILQLFAGATIAICLNLYVLKNIPRDELARFEPMRIVFSGGAWVIGPALGVYLGTQGADWLPYSVAAIFSLVQLVFFLLMRLQEPRGEMVDVVQSASPLSVRPGTL